MGSSHSHQPQQGAALPNIQVPAHSHSYSVGENVLLIGDAKTEAQRHGISEVVKILHLCQNPKNGKVLATVQLYKEGIPYEIEGGVGIPVNTTVLHLEDQIVPFPYFTHSVDCEAIKQKADSLTTCLSLDHVFGSKKFCLSEDDYDNVISELTEVKGPVGAVRYSMLSHPTESSPPVIIATIHGKGGINHYGLVSLTPDLAFKTAFLHAYDLPLTSPYYNAVPWHRVIPYTEFVGDEENQPYICKEHDNVWIYHKIKELLENGYQSVVIRLPYPV